MNAGGVEARQSQTRNDLAHALKDAGASALIAFGLFLPLIGFHAVQDIRNELVLETRWPLLAAFVILTMAGRLFGCLVVTPWRERRAARPREAAAARPSAAPERLFARLLAPAATGFVIVYPVLALWLAGVGGAVKWVDNFGIQILIYVMLGFGLNVVVGLAGLLDLGYVAFYAVGAYSDALLAKTFGLGFFML